MSVPQGSTPFNAQYYEALTARINSCQSCAQLQSVVTTEFASIQGTATAITTQIAALEPIMSLLSAPASNPGAIVSWITTLINSYLAPQIIPLTTMVAQMTELTAQVASLTSAIESAQGKFPSCSITIPPVS